MSDLEQGHAGIDSATWWGPYFGHSRIDLNICKENTVSVVGENQRIKKNSGELGRQS